MTDEQLVKAFLKGHEPAFETLMWRWQSTIFSFCCRYFANPEDARDLTQQTFIKAYNKLSDLSEPSRFPAWLYQIALNLCRDESRNKHRKHRSYITIDDYEQTRPTMPAGIGSSPSQLMQLQQVKQILQQALTRIPEEQRIVVIMKEYQDLKFVEIAEILDEPLNTVKSRLYYGLKALRKILEAWNMDKEINGYEMQ